MYANICIKFLFVKRGIVCQETKIKWFVRDWKYSWVLLHIAFLALSSFVNVACNVRYCKDSKFRAYLVPLTTFLSYFLRCKRHFIKSFTLMNDIWTWHKRKFRIEMNNIGVKEPRCVLRLISYALIAMSFPPLFNRLIFSLIAIRFICLVSHINTGKCVT